MDQNTILILVVAAMMAQKPAPACSTIAGAKPALPDITLNDASALSPADKGKLTALAGFMREHDCGVVIQGFTDPSGNERLDDRTRAKTVMDFLTRELPDSQRVRFNQVKTEAKGAPPGRKLRVDQQRFARVVL